MPGGNGTGPVGHGSMTGRGFGFCAGYSNPGCANPSSGRVLGKSWGRGIGRGYRGRGRGFWGRGFYQDSHNLPFQNRDKEKRYLENMAKGPKEEISSIRERISELSKEKKEKS